MRLVVKSVQMVSAFCDGKTFAVKGKSQRIECLGWRRGFRDSRPDRALLGSWKRTSHRERMDAPVAHDVFLFGGFRLDRHSGGLFRQDGSGRCHTGRHRLARARRARRARRASR